jgi:predicted metal-dependent HD superfamily phosphohydrolase
LVICHWSLVICPNTSQLRRKTLTNILLCRWQDTLQPFGIKPVAVEQAFTQVIEAYSTSNRYYHTIKHIDHILSTIDTLQCYVQDLISVQLAAWFHDIVYDTQAQDNEERSADYADDFLNSLELPLNKIATVNRLILNTKQHQADADDFDSQVLLDADLAILAVHPIQYQEYANAIRQEYAWVPEVEYIAGRRQILERFLQRQRIYFTPLMFEFAEESARSNLKAEIQILKEQKNHG